LLLIWRCCMSDLRDIRTLSTGDLRAELTRGLALTAQTLTRLATIWAELERRGEDLSDLRRGVAAMLPMIAAGTLAAEVVVGFGGRPSLLHALVGLPLERQQAIVAGEPVRLVVEAGDGEYAVRLLPASALTAAQVRQVFGVGQVRAEDEQRAIIEARRTPQRRRSEAISEMSYRVRPVPDKGGIKVGNSFAAVEDVVPALASLNGKLAVINVDDPTTETATVRLTADEKQKLRALEKSRGLPEWHLIREALKACGLI
jgi:hypothetical protein